MNKILGIVTELSMIFYSQTVTILEIIYKSLVEGLTRIVGNGRVCSK